MLDVCVEDVVGPRLPADEDAPEGPEEIVLDAFEAKFVTPDRGTAYVALLAESPAAKARAERLLADILRDRHKR